MKLQASKAPQHRLLVSLVTQPLGFSWNLENWFSDMVHRRSQGRAGCRAVYQGAGCALRAGTQRRGTWELKSSPRLCLLSVWSGVGLGSPAEEVSFSDLLKAVFGLAVTMDG